MRGRIFPDMILLDFNEDIEGRFDIIKQREPFMNDGGIVAVMYYTVRNGRITIAMSNNKTYRFDEIELTEDRLTMTSNRGGW